MNNEMQNSLIAKPGYVPTQGVLELPPNPNLPEPFMKQCLCFSLRTGCLIFGWLSVILELVGVILLIVMMISISKVPSYLENMDNPELEDQFMNSQIQTHVLTAFLLIVIIVGIVVFGVMLLSELLLLFGVYKKMPTLLMIYFVINLIAFALAGIAFIRDIATGMFDFGHSLYFIVGIIWIGLKLVVVHCYYRILKIELDRTPVYFSPPTTYVA